jgi:hypothetical protein
MLGPFCLHGCWQEDERKAERLAQRIWSEQEREGRQLDTFAQRLGNGQVAFPRWTATLRVLPWAPLRWEGWGANPECAVKSTDKFLMLPSRIEDEIKD